MEMRPEAFSQEVDKLVRLEVGTREELLEFFDKYLMPEIRKGCGLKAESEKSIPTQKEAHFATRILKIRYFYDLRDLRGEAYRISEKTPLAFEEVAAIITDIARKHICDQFGEGEAVKLEITDN